MPESFISCYNQLVLAKVIEDRFEKVHGCVLPEASKAIEGLMSEYIGHGSKFVIGTMFVKLLDIFEDVIGDRKILKSDIFKFP